MPQKGILLINNVIPSEDLFLEGIRSNSLMVNIFGCRVSRLFDRRNRCSTLGSVMLFGTVDRRRREGQGTYNPSTKSFGPVKPLARMIMTPRKIGCIFIAKCFVKIRGRHSRRIMRGELTSRHRGPPSFRRGRARRQIVGLTTYASATGPGNYRGAPPRILISSGVCRGVTEKMPA